MPIISDHLFLVGDNYRVPFHLTGILVTSHFVSRDAEMKKIEESLALSDGTGSLPPRPSSFRNEYFEVPRNASPAFTGRAEVCEQLQAGCLPSSQPHIRRQQQRFVIYGLGGSGKTQICLKFAEDHREESVYPPFSRSGSDSTSDSGAYSG